jgi:uncharacterized Zn finger protein
MSYDYYPKYVSVAEKKAKAKKKIKQLRKKNPDLQPVILDGQALATTWWGKAWNKNLESYADYSNRIGRGRSYVRHMAVVDLQVAPGRITALVQGAERAPYAVIISIARMKKANWQSIKKECQRKLSSLPDLLAGKIPKALQETFMIQGKGLFPEPSEISFDCSCPDWASMCKHIAAALYGVGARLDDDPSLFFTLRKADINNLVSQAVQSKTSAIIDKDPVHGSKVIADDKLADLFGLDLDDLTPVKPVKTTEAKTKKRKRPVGKKSNISKSAKKSQRNDLQGHSTAIALVLHCINESRESLSVKDLQETTGFPAGKLYGILFRLKQQRKIQSPAHGIYSRISVR